MKNSTLLRLLFTILLCPALAVDAQSILVNVDTVTYHGYTDTVDYAPLIINVNGNVVVSGNQKVSATQYDANTASSLNDGVSVWANSFNPGSDKSYITASVNDISGNLIVVGGVKLNSGSSVDFMILKYDAAGTLQWSSYYNGPNSTTDFAIAVDVDPNGNIYVTGASDGTNTALVDYATLCYSPSGAQVWCSRYNYNSQIDIPTAIDYDDLSNEVIVTGSSGSSLIDWDFATVQYDANTGTQLNVTRNTNNNNAQDKVMSMATDTLGNVYIAGTVYNGTDFDLQVSKLDTALTLLWSQTFNGHGFDDAAMSIDLDDSSNVYVAGLSHTNNTNKEYLLLKYSNNGVLRWRSNTQKHPLIDAEALKVKVKSFTEIFIGGNLTLNGNQDVFISRFNNKGVGTLEKIYNGPANLRDQFMDFELDGNKIYVSARTDSGAVAYNITLHLSYKERTINVDTLASDSTIYSGNEVIIEFQKSVLKMNKIDDRDFVFGKLSDFVQDSTCLKIGAKLDSLDEYRIEWKNLATQKIFLQMNSTDTLSETRLGTFIRIPNFYCNLLVSIPQSIATSTVPDALITVRPDICNAQLNYIYELDWVPNDTYYSTDQTSLHPNVAYPFAHINCQPAWDYTKGHPFVRAGVYDTGISDNAHPDLQWAIVDFKDYSGSSVVFANDYDGHGTGVAGIIGAKGNNGQGVAGIAGGDVNALPPSNTGVSLINMKTNEPTGNGPPTTNVLMNAYYDGSNGTNVIFGKGLHIMNHSYGYKGMSFDISLAKGINYANQNGVAFVASRGNYTVNSPVPITTHNSPGTMKPGKVMCVGASGNDGNHHKMNVNGTVFSSMTYKNVDFLAPGNPDNIKTVKTNYNHMTSIIPPVPSYISFGGTSASAPHVSGVTALMMSYRNQSTPNWDNIVHEDCEEILKMTATDLTVTPNYNQFVGPDSVSGWGRIDAAAALAALEPQYKIRHIDRTHYSSSYSTSTTNISSSVYFWSGLPGNNVAPGYYDVTMTKVTTIYSYNFPGETYEHSWPLYMASAGCPTMSTVTPPVNNFKDDEYSYVELIAATISSATLATYIYKVNFNTGSPNTPISNKYIPFHLNDVNSAFTLYTLVTPVGLGESATSIDYINLYPNPTNDNVRLGFYSKKDSYGHVQIFDIMGNVVFEKNDLKVQYGINRMDISTINLAAGVYLVKLVIDTNKPFVKKLIIQR